MLANSAAALLCFGLPNSADIATDERGWTQIPFGMWPHTAGFQRFGQKEAECIVEAFRSVCGRLRRAMVGLPVFKGHPDNPDLANQYPDKTEYGQVADMEVTDEGLRIRHILSNAGATLVSKLGLDRISPNWLVEDTGEKKEGRTIYVPIAIKSIGLVKRPNIPNLSLANSSPTTMKENLIKLLSLANEATDEQIVAAITALTLRPKSEDHDKLKNDLALANSSVATLTIERDNEKRRADSGATALANERKVAVSTTIDEAIKTGRIAAADKPVWEKVLANDFEAGKKALSAIPAKVKTQPRVQTKTLADADAVARRQFANGGADEDGADPGADGNDHMSNRASRIQKLVNAEMESLKNCGMTGNGLRNKAWANVKRNYPKLFEPLAKGTEARADSDDE